jgi:hypothetical protein
VPIKADPQMRQRRIASAFGHPVDHCRSHVGKRTDDGRQWLLCDGHLPEREITTGIGPVPRRRPRGRDGVGEGLERIRVFRRSCLTTPADGRASKY